MKEKEKDELGQSVLNVILFRLGNLTLISGKKDVITSLFDFHKPTQNWVYFPEKTYCLLFKVF